MTELAVSWDVSGSSESTDVFRMAVVCDLAGVRTVYCHVGFLLTDAPFHWFWAIAGFKSGVITVETYQTFAIIG